MHIIPSPERFIIYLWMDGWGDEDQNVGALGRESTTAHISGRDSNRSLWRFSSCLPWHNKPRHEVTDFTVGLAAVECWINLNQLVDQIKEKSAACVALTSACLPKLQVTSPRPAQQRAGLKCILLTSPWTVATISTAPATMWVHLRCQ